MELPDYTAYFFKNNWKISAILRARIQLAKEWNKIQ